MLSIGHREPRAPRIYYFGPVDRVTDHVVGRHDGLFVHLRVCLGGRVSGVYTMFAQGSPEHRISDDQVQVTEVRNVAEAPPEQTERTRMEALVRTHYIY